MKPLARTTFWIVALAFIILAASMCNRPLHIEGAAPTDPTLLWFLSRTQTNDRVTMVYGVPSEGTVARVKIDGPCLMDTGGIAVRYNGKDDITLLETGFDRGLNGATISIRYAPTKYTVVGIWVSAEYPGGLAANSRWAMFPMWAYTEGNPTPYTQMVEQCDQSPVALPLITSGPAEPGFLAVCAVLIVFIFALWDNARSKPRPPHR